MGVCCSNNYEIDEEIHKQKTLEDLIILIRARRKEFITNNCQIKQYMTNSNKHHNIFKVNSSLFRIYPSDIIEKAYTEVVCFLFELVKYVTHLLI